MDCTAEMDANMLSGAPRTPERHCFFIPEIKNDFTGFPGEEGESLSTPA